MTRRILPGLAIVALIGAGCTPETKTADGPRLPFVQILSPANGTTADADSVAVVGRANTADVVIGSSRHPVIDETFSVPVALLPGENRILIQAGNGFTTTTQTLRIQRTQ